MPRRYAAIVPSGTATTSANTSPHRASWYVAGQPLRHQGQRRLVHDERFAEVAADGTGREAEVLDEQRLIQAHFTAEQLTGLLRRIQRQQDRHWIAEDKRQDRT